MTTQMAEVTTQLAIFGVIMAATYLEKTSCFKVWRLNLLVSDVGEGVVFGLVIPGAASQGFSFQGLGFKVGDLGFRDLGLGFRI